MSANSIVVIVVDATVVVELLRLSTLGHAVATRIRAGGGRLHAPHLLGVEVASALRRLAATGEIDRARGGAAIMNLTRLGVTRYPHEPLLPRIWQLRDNLSANDAAYVALAESLDAPLLTLDARLARAPGHRADVELLTD